MEKKDWIDLVCGGFGERFNGKSCHHYDSSSRECLLLREKTIKDLLEDKTNCDPSYMVKSSVKKHLNYKNIDKKDDMDDIVGNVWVKLIKFGKLKIGYNLAVLKVYIHTTAFSAISDFYKKHCGICFYLSPSKPHLCQRKTISTEKGEEPNPHYGEVRIPSNRTCKEGGFQAFTEQSISNPEDDNEELSLIIAADGQEVTKSNIGTIQKELEEQTENTSEIENLIKKLADRIDTAGTDKKKDRYKRQHLMFVKLCQFLSEGVPLSKAITKLSEKSGKNEEQEWKEIKKFLTENVH